MMLTWCATAALRTSFKLLQIYSYTDTSWDDDRNSCKSTCSSCITPFHMHSLMSPDALALLSDALPPLALLLPSPDALVLLSDALPPLALLLPSPDALALLSDVMPRQAHLNWSFSPRKEHSNWTCIEKYRRVLEFTA